MERIASFCVDHTKLDRGMYLSRQDGDVLTWDTLTKEVYPQKEENSNLYHGLTKKLTFDQIGRAHV